ncbi:hypothetical protein CTAYLR_002675 [Chrysophaeum taylorii]|uniref:Uncharacterized protein n=1 Tax=Chrysophaeum taylorii TaxID=2483200 RepID=A0AAD7UC61_9STRA|nr:hypothetical protein CTAYLR_002675 [Chrysophaeum taylorii]
MPLPTSGAHVMACFRWMATTLEATPETMRQWRSACEEEEEEDSACFVSEGIARVLKVEAPALEARGLRRLVGTARPRLRGWVMRLGVEVQGSGDGAALLAQAHARLDVWTCRAVLRAWRNAARQELARPLCRRALARWRAILRARQDAMLEHHDAWLLRTAARRWAVLSKGRSRRRASSDAFRARVWLERAAAFVRVLANRAEARRMARAADRGRQQTALRALASYGSVRRIAGRALSLFEEARREARVRAAMKTLVARAWRAMVVRRAVAARRRERARRALHLLLTAATGRRARRTKIDRFVAKRALWRLLLHATRSRSRAAAHRRAEVAWARSSLAKSIASFAYDVKARRAARGLATALSGFGLRAGLARWRRGVLVSNARRRVCRKLAKFATCAASRKARDAVDRWRELVRWRRELRDRTAAVFAPVADRVADRVATRSALRVWTHHVRCRCAADALLRHARRRSKRLAWRQWLRASRRSALLSHAVVTAATFGARAARRLALKGAFATRASRRALRRWRRFAEARRARRASRRNVVAFLETRALYALSQTVAVGRLRRKRAVLRAWRHLVVDARRDRKRRVLVRWRRHVDARAAFGRLFARAFWHAYVRCLLKQWRQLCARRRRRRLAIYALRAKIRRLASETLRRWRIHARLERAARRFLQTRSIEARRSPLIARRVLRAWRNVTFGRSSELEDTEARRRQARERAILLGWTTTTTQKPLPLTPTSASAAISADSLVHARTVYDTPVRLPTPALRSASWQERLGRRHASS